MKFKLPEAFCTFRLGQDDMYFTNDRFYDEFRLLCNFLTKDYVEEPMLFNQWLMHCEKYRCGPYDFDVFVREDEIVVFYEIEDLPYENYTEFSMSINNFRNMLYEWDKILNKMPNRVVVMKDGDKIYFKTEGINKKISFV